MWDGEKLRMEKEMNERVKMQLLLRNGRSLDYWSKISQEYGGFVNLNDIKECRVL